MSCVHKSITRNRISCGCYTSAGLKCISMPMIDISNKNSITYVIAIDVHTGTRENTIYYHTLDEDQRNIIHNLIDNYKKITKDEYEKIYNMILSIPRAFN